MRYINKTRLRIHELIFCIIVLVISTVSPSLAVTPEPPSNPPGYVVDLAGIIRDDVETRLNAYLKELEEKTSAQVVILTIKSLDGEDIEGFSLRMAERWRPGQKGKDNGLLITIALNDRKYRFEVGYGLEGILPDSLVGSIGRQYLVPYFREGDYTTGIFRVTIEVIGIISKNYGVEISGLAKNNKKEKQTNEWINIVAPIFFAIIMLIAVLKNIFYSRKRRYYRYYGGFWSGGFGGFSGGGSGGFSGGGGSFGGGGASGSW